MKMITQLTLLVSIAAGSLAQSQAGDVAQQSRRTPETNDTGVVSLAGPYAISTAPHFAVLVQFPKADSIRRIALGDSNYFLAEADKTDPHYAIIKQIEAPAAKSKTRIKRNIPVNRPPGPVATFT